MIDDDTKEAMGKMMVLIDAQIGLIRASIESRLEAIETRLAILEACRNVSTVNVDKSSQK